MFGALLGLFGLGASGVGEAKRICKDGGYRDSAYKNGSVIYYDSKGIPRSVKTNNKVTKGLTIQEKTYWRDTKTHETIIEINPFDLNKKRQAKEEAQRRGQVVYHIRYACGTSEDLLVSNDFPVKQRYGGWVIPEIPLYIYKDNDEEDIIIRRNREELFNWFRTEWYKYGSDNKDNRKVIKELADKYGIKIFKEDLDYCYNMYKTGGFKEFVEWKHDPTYYKASWVEEKYWI